MADPERKRMLARERKRREMDRRRRGVIIVRFEVSEDAVEALAATNPYLSRCEYWELAEAVSEDLQRRLERLGSVHRKEG